MHKRKEIRRLTAAALIQNLPFFLTIVSSLLAASNCSCNFLPRSNYNINLIRHENDGEFVHILQIPTVQTNQSLPEKKITPKSPSHTHLILLSMPHALKSIELLLHCIHLLIHLLLPLHRSSIILLIRQCRLFNLLC